MPCGPRSGRRPASRIRTPAARKTSRAASPRSRFHRRARRTGPAGSGSARLAAASGGPTTRCIPTIRSGAGLSQGLGTNSIGSLALDSNDPQRQHDLRRHRRDQPAEQLRRRHGTLSIDRRRRHLDARADDDRRSGGLGRRDRLHLHARHQHRRRRAGQLADDLRRDDDRDAGHDGRARRADAVARLPAASRRALQDRQRRHDVVAHLGAAARSRPSGESAPRGRRRRHDVRRPPRQARSARCPTSSTRRPGTTRSIDRRRRSRTATRPSSRSTPSWASTGSRISRCST